MLALHLISLVCFERGILNDPFFDGGVVVYVCSRFSVVEITTS